MKLGTETIGEVPIDVDVTPHGEFIAEFDGQTYRASTRIDLLEKLRTAVKKAQRQGVVDVTVLNLKEHDKKGGTFLDAFDTGDGFVHAKLRSKHEREHSTWLLVSESKKKFKVSSYDKRIIARRLTAQEGEEYWTLVMALRAAESALRAFTDSVEIDPDEALKKAQK